MVQDIQTALAQIYRIEAALAVTSPEEIGILKVWPYEPTGDAVITATPAFVNDYTIETVSYQSAIKRLIYSVNARLCIYRANPDSAAVLASAFTQPIIDAFSQNIKLGMKDWMVRELRFNGKQPVVHEVLSAAAGKTLIGLDFNIDLEYNHASTNAVGAVPL